MNREVSKIAKLGHLVLNEDELAKINEFTLHSVAEKDVFVYKIVVADNELEYDRDFEPLTLSALEDLQKHLVGKTMIFDHNPSAENQVARIYISIHALRGEGDSKNAQILFTVFL